MADTGRDRAIYAGGFGVACLLGAAYLWAETHLGTPHAAWPPWLWGLPATAGCGLLAFASTVFLVSAPQVSWQPWIDALSRLAREHGQEVQDDLDRGLWFDAVHGGPRFTINVLPTTNGHIRLFSKRQARHGVVVLRANEAPGDEFANWAPVVKGRGWTLYAEVVIAARSIQANVRLAAALERFFGTRSARSVLFAGDGLKMEMGLVRLESVDAAIREAIEIGRQLWDATD